MPHTDNKYWTSDVYTHHTPDTSSCIFSTPHVPFSCGGSTISLILLPLSVP